MQEHADKSIQGNIEPIIINLCCSKAYRFDFQNNYFLSFLVAY